MSEEEDDSVPAKWKRDCTVTTAVHPSDPHAHDEIACPRLALQILHRTGNAAGQLFNQAWSDEFGARYQWRGGLFYKEGAPELALPPVPQALGRIVFGRSHEDGPFKLVEDGATEVTVRDHDGVEIVLPRAEVTAPLQMRRP